MNANSHRPFPNLACHGDVVDHPEVDDHTEQELKEAGITVIVRTLNPRGEVPTTVESAHAYGWRFTRAWYYWQAHAETYTRRVPLSVAETFLATWGREVRAGGHCACPSPREYPGCDVESYHIDTQDGLNAFVELLRLRANIEACRKVEEP